MHLVKKLILAPLCIRIVVAILVCTNCFAVNQFGHFYCNPLTTLIHRLQIGWITASAPNLNLGKPRIPLGCQRGSKFLNWAKFFQVAIWAPTEEARIATISLTSFAHQPDNIGVVGGVHKEA